MAESTYATPDLEELHQLMVDDHGNQQPDDDVSPGSDNYKRLRTTALAATDLHAHADQVYTDLLPDEATGAALARLGNNVYGVTQKKATVASRADALKITGDDGSSYTAGDELTHTDGTRYKITESGTLDATRTATLDVESIDTGSKCRKAAGEILTFVDPPTGINSKAELQLPLNVGGDDEENDGSWSSRILDKIASPGMGGNANDYRTWGTEEEAPHVTESAYVYSRRNGDGSVDVAILKSGTAAARALSEQERADFEEYINEKRPVSVKDFRVLTTTARDQDVEATIVPEDGSQNAFDWNDDTPPVVDSYNSVGTRVLRFVGSRPSDMAVGDRLVIKNSTGTRTDGAEVIVESLGPGAKDVKLKAGPVDITGAPVSAGDLVGATVYSGGPLVEPGRLAILALFKTLGPARGSYAAHAWVGDLLYASLFKALQLTKGVLNSIFVTPTADVAAVDTPPNSSIEFLAPRQVIVRSV